MMLSMTGQYALRAIVYIAANSSDEKVVLSREIAEKTGVPSQYLSQILRDAVRAGVLESSRGVGGGFRLSRPAARIRLLDVLAPFEDVLKGSRCPFGQPRCNDEHPCGFHEFWKPVSRAFRQMLEQTTLDQVDSTGLTGRGRKRQER